MEKQSHGDIQTHNVRDQMWAVFYGNCIGDALGLLTKFMTKEEATKTYKKFPLKYEYKINDSLRSGWKTGDWTGDSDEMILILESIVANQGEIVPTDFAQRMLNWSRYGFKDLGDTTGIGMGKTTSTVLNHPEFLTDPHKAAYEMWVDTGRQKAANGAIMRSSVLGLHQYTDTNQVIKNTVDIARVTHADPRCQLSCVAMTTSIALMLQGKHLNAERKYDVENILLEAFQLATQAVHIEWGGFSEDQKGRSKKELKDCMFAEDLSRLKLDQESIGYTYKCLGAGCWALRQDNFQDALHAIFMEAGDADTNGAVAGAMLACKLGLECLTSEWLHGLIYKDWLDKKIDRFLDVQKVKGGDRV